MKLQFVIIVLLSYIAFAQWNIHAQQSNESAAIKKAIITGNLRYLSDNFNQQNINLPLGDTIPPPLIIAIQYKQYKTFEYLINHKKADPNIRYNGQTPLMIAVENDNFNIIKNLVKNGANINDLDSLGNTSFMLAAKKQPAKVIRFLFRNGGWLYHKNFKGFNAFDYAVQCKNNRAESILKHLEVTHLPNYTDGPYIKYLHNNKIKITYLIHDSLRRKFIKQEFVSSENPYHPIIQNIAKNNDHFIKDEFNREPSVFSDVKKLLIIGDIHGQCDTLIKFLIANNVINNQLEWIFGNGHIVFLGDIFDRGEHVTESLWLVYQLEQEASKHEGKIHVLLGNHELMVLGGDLRYTNDKYFQLTKNLSLSYQKLFSEKTVLGRWIRSKNTIIKINDNLFVHAGLHPVLLKKKLNIDSLNNLVYKYLNSKKINISLPPYNIIFGNNGPFWFRGLITNHVINEHDVDSLLLFFNAKRIFVGHTSLPRVTNFYNGKVWGMDIPFYLYTGSPMEALLLENNKAYLLTTSGKVNTLKITNP